MNINIICIGKLKEKYWQSAIQEYIKRLGPYCNIKIVELKESRLPSNASLLDERKVVETEGDKILEKICENDYTIALEIEGKMFSSLDFAQKIEKVAFEKSTIDFIIGGSLGLSEKVGKRADLCLSFGRITFPHQLARVVLVEQIYRAFKINNNEKYHK
ncbi:MAG: 23S rRNA (pseudouridine(1915)-N(3))-methyltransferase RlmH [Clostridiales bacterium]|nr:23S rRNA (pseudouridine(1915)-N(3))-methyltransferase RlmH [Clostridiales bacterium]